MHEQAQEIENIDQIKKDYSGGEITKPRFDNVLKKYNIINDKIKDKEVQNINKEIKLIDVCKKKTVTPMKIEHINSIANSNNNTNLNTPKTIENIHIQNNLFNKRITTVKNTALNTNNNSRQISEERSTILSKNITKSPVSKPRNEYNANLNLSSKSKILNPHSNNSKVKIFSPGTATKTNSTLATNKNTQLNTNKNSLKSSSTNSKTNLFANNKVTIAAKKDISQSKILKPNVSTSIENKYTGSKTGATTPKSGLIFDKSTIKKPNTAIIKTEDSKVNESFSKVNLGLKSTINLKNKNLSEKSTILNENGTGNGNLINAPINQIRHADRVHSTIQTSESQTKSSNSKLGIKVESIVSKKVDNKLNDSRILNNLKNTSTSTNSPTHFPFKFQKEKPKTTSNNLKLGGENQSHPSVVQHTGNNFNKSKVNTSVASINHKDNKIISAGIHGLYGLKGQKPKGKEMLNLNLNEKLVTNNATLNTSETSIISTTRESHFYKSQAENIIKAIKDCKLSNLLYSILTKSTIIYII